MSSVYDYATCRVNTLMLKVKLGLHFVFKMFAIFSDNFVTSVFQEFLFDFILSFIQHNIVNEKCIFSIKPSYSNVLSLKYVQVCHSVSLCVYEGLQEGVDNSTCELMSFIHPVEMTFEMHIISNMQI